MRIQNAGMQAGRGVPLAGMKLKWVTSPMTKTCRKPGNACREVLRLYGRMLRFTIHAAGMCIRGGSRRCSG